ncbi:uncharacterized lipoprotein YddW (UPF0748 family) [Anaerobacterium chartisolvens]|uniref:Uncharacterized lipoprotein YddW (UPF0748 family) n=1 Tax=Anaerobacterium chartisolvens TaxID=1297424 RepID=A0A369BAD3_9FIRM|nr:family 10 glycosylhydrolase [Anaerobacterium chartisolvens]RCX16644.1 uncharacterized lipoprotein YddW (UPF0748 family) [Anaerobacterium chartisolvens]
MTERKRIINRIILTVLLAFPVINVCSPALAVYAQQEFRGMWVATVYAIDYPSSGYTADDQALRADALKLLDDAKDMGFNAVFLQVRPSGDAFYKSKIFPWSKYLTGVQGKSPDNGFDPLAFFVDEAHKRGIELHAWVNPYRVTASPADNSLLHKSSPALLQPGLTVTHTDGRIYFNPGESEARQLIIDGIKEIIDNYDVDGIHMDDYFYPEGDFNDEDAFAKYGSGFTDIGDWRRNNNDLLISGIYGKVHEKDKGLSFGVSPGGIWANKSSNSLGSDTNGSQTYYKGYADTRGWVKKGYLDYILPQIYWNIGYVAADYAKLVDWWADVAQGTNVKLYIGQAAYKAGNTDITSPWYGVSEIERQVNINRNTNNVSGYSMYTYNYLRDNHELNSLVRLLNGTYGIPSVSGAAFSGEAVEGHLLTASYIYSDPLNRPEENTVFEWYIADKKSADYKLLQGEQSRTLLVKKEYLGKDIRVKITPKNKEAQGIGVFGDNGCNTAIAAGDVTRDGALDHKDALLLLQYTAGLVKLDFQQKSAGDYNNSNGINTADVKLILDYSIDIKH